MSAHKPPLPQSRAHRSGIFVIGSPSPDNNAGGEAAKRGAAPYRSPRVALIVVLPENYVVSPDQLAQRLHVHAGRSVDVVVACAGQPTNLAALQQSVGDAQFILAPAGTSVEDLRELAMRQVPGDIVTLVSGTPVAEAVTDSELSMSS